MIKLFKSFLLISVVAVGLSVTYAATPEEDLISYITQEHIVAGTSIKIGDYQRTQFERYIASYPVTAAQVQVFKSKAESIKAIMNAEGVIDPTKLTQTDKDKVTSLLIQAGDAIGVKVTINTRNNTVDFYDSTGALIDVFSFNGGKLPFTGSDVLLYDITASIVAMVAMFYMFKKRVV